MTAGSKRILVVDDSRLIRHLGKSALEKSGYEVFACSGLAEAENWLKESTPDLVLVDINMPEMTGDDMVPHLKQRVPVGTPIVLFSDIKEDELKDRAGISSAAGFISKHWGLQRMVEDVNRFIDTSEVDTDVTRPASAAPPLPANGAADDTPVPTTPAPGSAFDDADPLDAVAAGDDERTPRAAARAPRVPGADDAAAATHVPDDAPVAMPYEPGSSTASDTTIAVPAGSGASKGQLLLIDDSGLILKLAQKALETAGYQVAIASEFDEIHTILKTIDEPDLILIDINMPEVLGDDLVVFFRRRWEIKSPIVLFSNVPEKELDYRSKEAGANGWISKRWGIERLVEEVEKYVH